MILVKLQLVWLGRTWVKVGVSLAYVGVVVWRGCGDVMCLGMQAPALMRWSV